MKRYLLTSLVIGLLFMSCNSNNSSVANNNDSKNKAALTMNEKDTESMSQGEMNATSSSTNLDATTKKENSDPALGIDISNYQGNEVSRLDKSDSGLHFIICKATEGITYVDPRFKQNWEDIRSEGFIRGAYHFYRSNDNPSDQANNFIKALSSIKADDIAPIVDFEEGSIVGSSDAKKIQEDLLAFISFVEKGLNRKVIIYTDTNTGNLYLNNASFSDFALWIANYTDKDQPNVPTIWKNKDWSFWQKSDSYNIDGTQNDYDQYNGNLEALKSFISKY